MTPIDPDQIPVEEPVGEFGLFDVLLVVAVALGPVIGLINMILD